MKCDTCGKEANEVRRVVVDTDYDRVLSKPLYNCFTCFAAKSAKQRGEIRPEGAVGTDPPAPSGGESSKKKK